MRQSNNWKTAKRICAIVTVLVVTIGGGTVLVSCGNGVEPEPTPPVQTIQPTRQTESHEPTAASSEPAPRVTGGICGIDISWNLDSSGHMTISGQGEMTDFQFYDMPWVEHSSQIKSLTVEEGVTSIGDTAFYECWGLTQVDIADSVQSIGTFSFCHTGITAVSLPKNLVEIKDYAFDCQGVGNIQFPPGIERIGVGAFAYGNMTTLTVPDSVTEIGSTAFYCCEDLINVILSENMTEIDERVFFGCKNLTSITIPEGIRRIGSEAFLFCDNLKEVTVSPSCEIAEDAFFDTVTIAYY